MIDNRILGRKGRYAWWIQDETLSTLARRSTVRELIFVLDEEHLDMGKKEDLFFKNHLDGAKRAHKEWIEEGLSIFPRIFWPAWLEDGNRQGKGGAKAWSHQRY